MNANPPQSSSSSQQQPPEHNNQTQQPSASPSQYHRHNSGFAPISSSPSKKWEGFYYEEEQLEVEGQREELALHYFRQDAPNSQQVRKQHQ